MFGHVWPSFLDFLGTFFFFLGFLRNFKWFFFFFFSGLAMFVGGCVVVLVARFLQGGLLDVFFNG